jgi:hypothetical protein
MKNQLFRTWSLGLALAALPLAGGCDQETAESAPVPVSVASNDSVASSETTVNTAALTNVPAPEMTEMQLETAPGKIVSVAQPSAAASHLSSPSTEIVKLAQAGLDESVMLTYVTNSPHVFNLSSDDIVYLNDIGVPSSVVTAMIVHDQSVNGVAPGATVAATPPDYTNQLLPPPGTPTPYPETAMADAAGAEMADYAGTVDGANGSSEYFYDSLAPYGNWIDVAGYGQCWQPTVVVANPGWQPYCDRGHWVYSDCGWYWSSGYSWGWAPFHYGRWFHHSNWGWCWAPDTVWGPSWVTWRYTPGYCGWAPLPPSACFTPGVGFSHHSKSVSDSFGFGLDHSRFTFVSANRFLDPHLERHRLPLENSRQVFNNTVVFNHITQGRNNTVINEGIPVSQVAAATRTEIRRVHIRDTSDPVSARSEHIERDGSRSVAAFRPNLPQPTHSTALVGQGVPAAPRTATTRAIRPSGNQANGSRQLFTEANPNARDRRPDTTTTIRNNSSLPIVNDPQTANSPRDSRTVPNTGRTSPIIMRGPDRSGGADTERATAPRGSVIMSGPRNPNRVPTLNQQPQPATPTTVATPDTSPIQNNSSRVIVNPNQRQYTLPAQPAPSSAPGQNQNQRVYRSSDPRNPQYPQQDQRVYSQPAPPVQAPQSPVYQQPRAPEPPQQYRQANPVPQAPPQTYYSQPSPRAESPRQAESRQAPPPQQQQQQQQQSAPQARSQDNSAAHQTPAPGSGQGGGGGGGAGRRNR